MRCVMRPFNWAARERRIERNPFAGVEWPDCDTSRRPVTAEEYESLHETTLVRTNAELMAEIKRGLQALKGKKAKLYTLQELFK